MKFSRHEAIGFVSTWTILVAYFFVKINLLLPDSLLYQSLNLIGSFGIVFISFKKKAKQPMILNVVWMGVAIFAIGRLFL